MTVKRQQEIIARMGKVRAEQYIKAIFQAAGEMFDRWRREQIDRDWKRRVAVITRQTHDKA